MKRARASHRRRLRHASRGFTLLELIVAVGIMIIVAATATEAMTAAFKLKKSAENAVEATRDMELPGEIFVEELKNVPPPSTLSTQDSTAAPGSVTNTTVPYYFFGAFQGDSGTVTFFSTGLDRNSTVPSDVRNVEFTVITDKTGNGAFVRLQKSNLLEDQYTSPSQEVLVQNVISVIFKYWDGSAWQDTWDSTTNGNLLPFAVGMQLTLRPVIAGGPNRVITRFANIACAAPSTSTQAGISGLTGGLGQ